MRGKLLKGYEIFQKNEILWRQNPIITWLNEVDKNIKFFHSMANPRRNPYCNIVIERRIIGDPREIMERVVDHFFTLCKKG